MEEPYDALLGYECKVYYNDTSDTEIVAPTTPFYTVFLMKKSNRLSPRAFSVAALSATGTSVHTPPILIDSMGKHIQLYCQCCVYLFWYVCVITI